MKTMKHALSAKEPSTAPSPSRRTKEGQRRTLRLTGGKRLFSILAVSLAVFGSAIPRSQAAPSPAPTTPSRTVDLGLLEIEGELRRPNLQWLESSKRLKELLPRIFAEQFARLENELLTPMTPEVYRAELKKEEASLVSN